MADPAATTGVLLLNWRNAGLTERCLQDLLQQDDVPLRVLVMDNGSGDGSAERLRQIVDDNVAAGAPVEFQAFADNLGFCAAMNRGLAWAREAGLGYVLLLNNDMRLPRGFLRPLVAVLQNDPRVMAVGPTILDPAGRVWSQGGRLRCGPNLLLLRGHGGVPASTSHGPEAVDFLPGACALFRTADLAAAGGLDEGYFMYWEDVDVCRRLARRGTILWLPWVQVTHAGSRSSGGGRSPLRKFMMAANAARFLRRHGTARLWLGWLLFEVLLWPLSVLGGTGPRAALAKLRGTLSGLLGRRVTVADVERYLGAPRSPS